MYLGNQTTLPTKLSTDSQLPDILGNFHTLTNVKTPLLDMALRNGRKTTSWKIQNDEGDIMPQSALLTAVYAAVATPTTVTVADSSYFEINTVLRNETTGEHLKVTARPSATTLTCDRGVAGTTPAAGAVGERMANLGTAFGEGAAITDTVVAATSTPYNVLQIFRTMIQESRSREQEGTPDSSTFVQNLRNHLKQMVIQLERSLLQGIMDAGTVNANGEMVRITRGLLPWITSNVETISPASTITQTELEDFILDKVYAVDNGVDTKILFHGRGMLDALGKFASDTIPKIADTNTLGWDVNRYIVGGVSVDAIYHPLMRVGELSQIAFSIEPSQLAAYWKQDIILKGNIDNNNVDGHASEYITEIGWWLGNESLAAKMVGVTGGA